MTDVLKKFGRYFLLDMIAQGGMAEIYRARMASEDGAGRLLVIKRIQAGFGANNEFREMFKSEIKVTQRFTHPNIVQVYDYGEEGGQPYIAMEWVDGSNLRQILTRFSELKREFPIDYASSIIEQAASALHYAHAFKDRVTGDPLNLVHRDVSPQNIIVSYEGVVKLIDFGIAKAATNSEATRAGVIKGKISYLSPEQINGEALDGRSDIFALGIVFWELLVGRKLFQGDSDLAVLKMIENCNTYVKPPSALNPKVPKDLDYIVLRALAKQREKRFQTGEEMQRELHKFLYRLNPDFNPGDLAYAIKEGFQQKIVEDRKRIQRLNDRVEVLLAKSPVVEKSSSSSPSGLVLEVPGAANETEDTTSVFSAKPASPQAMTGSRELDPTLPRGRGAPRVEMDVSPPVRPQPRQVGSIGGSAYGPGSVAGRQVSRTSVRGESTEKVQKNSGSGFRLGGLIRVAAMGAAAMMVVGYVGPSVGVEVPILSSWIQELVSGGGARLVLQGNASNVRVLVNGKVISSSLPAEIGGVPVGTTFHVKVESSEGTFEEDFTLMKGERRVVSVALGGTVERAISSEAIQAASDPNAGNYRSESEEKVIPGKSVKLVLTVSPSATDAVIRVNGRKLSSENPSVLVSLNSPLELTVEKAGYLPFRREFVVDAGQVGNATEWKTDVQLEAARNGFLTLKTTPSADAEIDLGGGTKWVRKTPFVNERVPAGTYTLRLENKVLGMEKVMKLQVPENRSVVLEDVRLEIKR